MHSILEEFLDNVRMRGCSRLTVRRYSEVLRELEDFSSGCEPRTLTRHDLLRFATAACVDGHPRAPAGVNLRIAVLKATFSHLHREGKISADPAAALVGAKQHKRVPDYLTTPEVGKLLQHLETRSRPGRIRDLVLVLVFWQTGLRVSEVARLRWTQFDLERRCLHDVLVKGGHHREVPLNDETVITLSAYRVACSTHTDTTPMFVGRCGAPLSVRAIQSLFSIWRVELGWARRLHPHVLRRTHATGALALGVDIATVADLLGHQDLRTVTAYAAVQDGPRRSALRQLGELVPPEILEYVTARSAPANDTKEMTCVEERFYACGAERIVASGTGSQRSVA